MAKAENYIDFIGTLKSEQEKLREMGSLMRKLLAGLQAILAKTGGRMPV